MTAAARDFHSANILDAQWNAFYDFVNGNYKADSAHISSDSASQKVFNNILFKDEDSDIQPHYQAVNDFWIRMMRDAVAKNMNIGNNDHQLAQLNVRSVDARKAFLRDVISRAFVDFRKNQRLI